MTLVAGVAAFPSARFHAAAAGGALLWAGYAFSIGFFGGHTFSEQPLAGLLLALGMAAAVTLLVEAGRRLAGRHGCEARGSGKGREEVERRAVPEST